MLLLYSQTSGGEGWSGIPDHKLVCADIDTGADRPGLSVEIIREPGDGPSRINHGRSRRCEVKIACRGAHEPGALGVGHVVPDRCGRTISCSNCLICEIVDDISIRCFYKTIFYCIWIVVLKKNRIL